MRIKALMTLIFSLFALFILPAATHAAAVEYTEADRNGLWYLSGIVSGDAPEDAPRWIWGKLGFVSGILFGSSKGPAYHPAEPEPLYYTVAYIDAQLNWSGIITEPDDITTQTHGMMSPDKKLIAYTSSGQVDQAWLYKGNAFAVLMRRITEIPFQQTHLEGTWTAFQVLSGDADKGETPQVAYGTFDMDAAGAIGGQWSVKAAGASYSSNFQDILTVSPEGFLSSANSPSLTGTVNDDKNMMMMTESTSEGSVFRLMIRRSPDRQYALSDLTGSWASHGIVTGDAANGEDPRWTWGLLEVEEDGDYYGTVKSSSPDQATSDVTGTFHIDIHGNVTGSKGVMTYDGNMMVVADWDQENKGAGLSVYMKRLAEQPAEDPVVPNPTAAEEEAAPKTRDSGGAGSCFIDSVFLKF